MYEIAMSPNVLGVTFVYFFPPNVWGAWYSSLKLGVNWKIDYLGEIAKGVLALEGKVYVSFITMHFTYLFYAYYKAFLSHQLFWG